MTKKQTNGHRQGGESVLSTALSFGGVVGATMGVLLALFVITAEQARAQSTWRPDVRPRGGDFNPPMPPLVDPMRFHSIPQHPFVVPQGNGRLSPIKLSLADRDSLSQWFNLHSIEDLGRTIGGVLGSRQHDRRTPQFLEGIDVPFSLRLGFPLLAGLSDDTPSWMLRLAYSPEFQRSMARIEEVGDPAAAKARLLSTSSGFPLAGPHWQLGIHHTTHFPRLNKLNHELLGYELNVEDQRNHATIHSADGLGLSLERALTEHVAVRGSMELVEGESVDRQWWRDSESTATTASLLRDSQEVRFEGTSLNLALALRTACDRVRLGLAAGPTLEANRVSVRYAFDGIKSYEYETDRAVAAGLRVGVFASLGLLGPVSLTVSGGYKALSARELTIGGSPWYWHSGPGAAERATLDTDGTFVNLSLGFHF